MLFVLLLLLVCLYSPRLAHHLCRVPLHTIFALPLALANSTFLAAHLIIIILSFFILVEGKNDEKWCTTTIQPNSATQPLPAQSDNSASFLLSWEKAALLHLYRRRPLPHCPCLSQESIHNLVWCRVFIFSQECKYLTLLPPLSHPCFLLFYSWGERAHLHVKIYGCACDGKRHRRKAFRFQAN